MDLKTTLRAPNSLLLVVSADKPEIPTSIEPDSIVVHTSTCIVVGTIAEDDDEVTVVITDGRAAGDDLSLADDVEMDTSAGFIGVETVQGERLLTLPVTGSRRAVRVWASNLVEPDRVFIEVLDRFWMNEAANPHIDNWSEPNLNRMAVDWRHSDTMRTKVS